VHLRYKEEEEEEEAWLHDRDTIEAA